LLARQAWCAYPKNAHLRLDEAPQGQVALLLAVFRDDALEGKTTRSDVAVEIVRRITELAAEIRAAPHREPFLPAPEKFFQDRGWRKPTEFYTRKGMTNDIAQRRTLQSITEATLHRFGTPQTGTS
jgi:hypothetical protein